MGALVTGEGEAWRAEQACSWLSKVRSLAGYEAALVERAEAEFARADNLRSIDYALPRVRAARNLDAIPDAVAEHVDAGEQIAGIAAEAARSVADAAERLSRMDDPTDSELLTRYYLDPKADWRGVCEAMCYSYDGAMKRRRRALSRAYDVMPHHMRQRVALARPREYD